MSMNKDFRFSTAIKQYVQEFHQQNFASMFDYYNFMTTLSSKDRYGMWKNVGQFCDMDAKGCREYFHNTWCSQFFEPVANYRSELKLIAQQFNSPKEVIAEFIRRNPNKQFGKHELQVAVSTICKRRRNGNSIISIDSPMDSPEQLSTSNQHSNPLIVFDYIDLFQ
ncbi:Conserved_hypothetical protein [Hexamita inflata]|uniref:Uncharacterized protein n=1 Tax=Hexamita inflata TaxID=28002 RepID=A0AA86RAZ1_9EUKA|nr:Conserved hypothetical protein [Hexamita inflata]